AQRKQAEREYIQTVAQAMGWEQSSLEFPEHDYAHLSDAALNKLRQKHHQQLLKKADKVIDLQRQRLLADEEARTAADIGEVPLIASEDELTVDDLDPIRPQSSGLGYSTDYKGRAERAGLTEEELAQETGAVRAQK